MSCYASAQQWGGEQIKVFIVEELKPYYLVALIFAGIALLTLVGYLIWCVTEHSNKQLLVKRGAPFVRARVVCVLSAPVLWDSYV